MNFDLANTPIHKGVNRLEASAGTGKTFALAGLFLRLLLEEKLSARDILVVTFTEAATAELRERIRQRLSEALVAFHADSSEDPLLDALINRHQSCKDSAILSLRNALEVFDLVSISTIHGFCQRTLQDTAFESGILFDVELVTDQEDLIREVAADYCRKQLHDCDALLVSAALRAKLDPDTLSRLLRQYLTYPELELVAAQLPRSFPTIVADIRTHFAACVQAWRSAGIDRPGLGQFFTSLPKWSIKDHAKANLVDLHAGYLEACLQSASLAAQFWVGVEFFSASAVRAEAGKGKQIPASALFPALFETCERLNLLIAEFETAHRFEFLRAAASSLAGRKQEAKQQSYDDLITRLANALDRPSGTALSATIRRRYRAALIDESQDTDPLQWKIFHRVFAESPDHWLYLIGDPKQAIYGFRGADVNTYLQAAQTAQHQYSLGTNWRSESPLVEAVNAFFSAAGEQRAFVEQKIEFEAVQPALEADKKPILFPPDNERPAPFQVWCWEPDGGTVSSGKARTQLPISVAAEISRLLSIKPRLGDNQVLQPRDIAVLVESHRQAQWIQRALHNLGIPSVEQAMESVCESPEARELQWILTAVLAPGRETGVKAALTTDALGFNATSLQALVSNEQDWQQRLQAFATYRDCWENHGFYFMFVQLLRQEHVIEHLHRFPDAERRITNFIHLAELLEAAGKSQHLGPSRLLQWLEERRITDEAAPDEFQLRLESDEDAVQIVTIHRSKGLQYPVVFCPFVTKDAKPRQIKVNGRKVMDLVLYHNTQDGKLSWDIGKEPAPQNRQLAAREQLAEKVRLLYVALTRACNRCYLASARYARNKSTALAWLMHRSEQMPADPVAALNDATVLSVGWKTLWREMAAAAALKSNGKPAIAIADLPTEPGQRWTPPSPPSANLQPRSCQRLIQPAWYLSSFTNLSRELALRTAADEESGLPDHDEVTSLIGSPTGPPEALSDPTSIFALPSNARTGDCLHKILEQFDFSQPDPQEVSSLVRQQLEAAGLASDAQVAAVLEMLARVRQTTLDPARPDFTLARVPAAQRLTELEFHFPAARLDGPQLIEIIRQPEALALSEGTLPSPQIHAFLKGYIDLVFLFEGRYYLVDWKSNLLGHRVEDYSEPAMKAAVEDNFYDLQYHLYTVALDKFLRSRLAGYDYESHFGGVHYLFLRGLDPGRPHFGVWHARPSLATLTRLHALLGNSSKATI